MSPDSFLRAVISAPDDDLPRLIYADWLDEHLQPERAEFIRVQVGIARPRDDSEKKYGPRSEMAPNGHTILVRAAGLEESALLERERELLSRPPAGHRWWGWQEFMGGRLIDLLNPCAGPKPPEGYVFRRGFLKEAACEWAWWQQFHEGIRAETPLKKVRLTTEPVGSQIHFEPMRVGENYNRCDLFPGIEFDLAPAHCRRA